MYLIIILGAAAAAAVFLKGVHIIRPAERGLVETFGRAGGYLKPGFHWRLPAVQRVYRVGVAERRLRLGMLRAITGDNAAAIADAEITARLKDDKMSVRKAFYTAGCHEDTLVSLAQAALLDILGAATIGTISADRRTLGDSLLKALAPAAEQLGMEILRAGLMEIEFPKDIQESVHSAVRAAYEKRAAADFAAAAEKTAEGMKRADIRKAEGKKQAQILEAEGRARAIRLIGDASRPYVSGSANLASVLTAALRDGPACFAQLPDTDGNGTDLL